MCGMPEIPEEFLSPRKPREEPVGLHIVIRVIQLTIIGLLSLFLS